MGKSLVKRKDLVPREVDRGDVEVVRPSSHGNAWFSFRYSHTEVSLSGGRARIASKHARYEDGKLTTEAFEGEIDRSVYERMTSDAQRFFSAQASWLLQGLGLFLPAATKRGRREE